MKNQLSSDYTEVWHNENDLPSEGTEAALVSTDDISSTAWRDLAKLLEERDVGVRPIGRNQLREKIGHLSVLANAIRQGRDNIAYDATRDAGRGAPDQRGLVGTILQAVTRSAAGMKLFSILQLRRNYKLLSKRK